MSARARRIRLLGWVCFAVAIVSVVAAVAYFRSDHVKHGLAFIGLAVVALIGAWFLTAPDRTPSAK